MDVVPERKDFLGEFIAGLESEESERVKVSYPEDVKESNVWIDIEEALNDWTDRILKVENEWKKTTSFRENIEASLKRQQLDGFLNDQDIAELRYIADIWVNLLKCMSSYTIGCEFVKRDIITYLLELYKLRQINDCLFIEACLKLS